MCLGMVTAAADLVIGEWPEQRADQDAWAMVFAHMPALETLIIDFETVEEHKEAMAAIAAWARTWQFLIFNNPPREFVRKPYLADPQYDVYADGPDGEAVEEGPVRRSWLSAETEIEKMSWRGFRHHLPVDCHRCGMQTTNNECPCCLKRARLSEQGRGPRLYMWTVTWYADPEEGEEPSDAATEAAESSERAPEPAPEPAPPLTLDEIRKMARRERVEVTL